MGSRNEKGLWIVIIKIIRKWKGKIAKRAGRMDKKVKEDVEKSTEESEGGTISGTLGGNAWASGIEKRTLELAKRYDLLNNK